ncbi:MAG: efflux RND transporter periplasmic adaptor subunit [Thiohalocapsa sp.]|nr:efflux RND transporter periplasmic adaptor subunit [Thiohalocapsa sp.]
MIPRAGNGTTADIRRRLYALGLCACWLAAAAAAPPDFVPISADQQRAFGIETAAPAVAEGTLSRRYPARIAVPNRQLRIVAAPQPGVLEALLVAEGESVEAGRVLASLKSPELVNAQSAYLEAMTRLDLAESEHARDRKLHAEGVIAERRLLESSARRTELATLLEQRRQVLRLAGMSAADVDTLAQTRQLTSSLAVRSPIAGVILEQMVSTGESVAAAAPLYRVAQLDPLWVEVHVPVDRLGGIAEGARVLLPEQGIEGRVITVGRMVHGEDQGVLVRAEVREGTGALRPGQFAEVQLVAAGDEGEQWRIPAAAVVRDAGEAYVFAAADGGFVVRPVQVLAEEDRTTVVGGNLDSAVRLAVSGTVALKAAWLGGKDSGSGQD